jgi:hypothetical protein
MESNSYLQEFQDSYHIHHIPFDGEIKYDSPLPTMNSDETILYYIWRDGEFFKKVYHLNAFDIKSKS